MEEVINSEDFEKVFNIILKKIKNMIKSIFCE